MGQLDAAAHQLTRITENKAIRESKPRSIFRKRSIQLMTKAVKFFDSALRYFADGYFRNFTLLKC
jgi:hypothetical protein